MIDKIYVKALRRLEETYHVRFPSVAYTDLSDTCWFSSRSSIYRERYKCSSDSGNFGWNYGIPTLIHSVDDKIFLYQNNIPVYKSNNPGIPDGLHSPSAILDAFGNTLSQIRMEPVVFVECADLRFRMEKIDQFSEDLADRFGNDYEIFFSGPEKENLYASMMTLPRRMHATLVSKNDHPINSTKTTLDGLYQEMCNLTGSRIFLGCDFGSIPVWVWKFGKVDCLDEEYFLVYQDSWNDPYLITDSGTILRSTDGMFSSIFRQPSPRPLF
jgi:hypothetical protein